MMPENALQPASNLAAAVASPACEDSQSPPAPSQAAEAKLQALGALNSAFCQHIYSTALQYLQQTCNADTVAQQFMDILDKDDPYDSPCSIANHAANSAKNRYRDVVPYDHNRVHLPVVDDDNSSRSNEQALNSTSDYTACSSSSYDSLSRSHEDSTYINASFMNDPQSAADGSHVLGYIATQGPLPNTVVDFWRMVAATNSSAIVMLTGLTDGSPTLGNSRPRCAAYFPEEEQDCLRLPGDITVTCVHKNTLDAYVFVRQLEVSWLGCPQQEPLWINHYQYSAWPDYGVPPQTHSVLALSHALDSCRRAGCKIIVHCSAGVGRTGTFVAVDILLQRLQRLTLQLHGSVKDEDIHAAMDIAGLVLSLRKQRRGTVQTGEQYGFIWHAVMEELQRLLQHQQQLAASMQHVLPG